MRITKSEGFTLEEALLPDDPLITFSELCPYRGRADTIADEELGLRRLLEYPEDVAPSFLFAVD